MGVVVRHLADAGARTVVVSGVLEGALPEVAEALDGVRVTFCRLRAEPEVLRRRLERRYGPDDVERALAEAQELEERDRGHPVVDSGEGTPQEVARRVLSAVAAAAPSTSTALAAPEPPDLAPSGGAHRAVLVCGPAGVGGSALGFGLAARAWGSGRPCAYLDLQQLGLLADVPLDHAARHQLAAACVADLWQEYRAVGAEDLVMSGVVASPQDVEPYRAALAGTPLVVVRLRAGRDELRRRIGARSRGEGVPELAGDALRGLSPAGVDAVLDDASAFQTRLEQTDVADVVLDTDGLDPRAATRQLEALWDARSEH